MQWREMFQEVDVDCDLKNKNIQNLLTSCRLKTQSVGSKTAQKKNNDGEMNGHVMSNNSIVRDKVFLS